MNYDRAILRQNYITLKIKASIHEQLTTVLRWYRTDSVDAAHPAGTRHADPGSRSRQRAVIRPRWHSQSEGAGRALARVAAAADRGTTPMPDPALSNVMGGALKLKGGGGK